MTDSLHESPKRNLNGPGRMLRDAREQVHISVEDLSAQIKLTRGTLDALERDDFAQLNEPVYVRGYYRKISKVLPVAEADLLRAYESLVTPKAPAHPSKLILAGGQELGSGSRINAKIVVIAAIAGLLIALILFWGSRRAENAATTVQQATPPVVNGAQVPSTPKPVTALPPAAVATNPEAAPGTTPEQEMHSSKPASTASTADVPGKPAQTSALAAEAASSEAISPAVPAPGDASLELTFAGTSWAEIKDASGRALLSGVVQGGASRSITGRPPFNVFLGNAPGVQMNFNGSKVDMSLYTRSNNTARFKLP